MNEFDYLAKAKKNMDKGQYQDAITFCDKALKINNNLTEAYSFRGNAKYELGKYDSAIEDFSIAIEKEPNDAEHYYDRSWAYYYVDNFEDSIIDINKALKIEPTNSLYYLDKGRFEYWAGRYKEAIIDLTKGIELKPSESKYIFRANSYMELEEYKFALADFNAAIEIDPEFARAYYRRGILYKKMELLEKAKEDFKKAFELSTQYDDAMIQLGFIKIQLGEKDAMKYFNKAIKTYPSAENYYWRIKARQNILNRKDTLTKLSTGKFVKDDCDENKIFNEDQARNDIKDLNKAIALTPDDTLLYEMRAERFKYLKKYKNAIKDYNFLIKNFPEKHLNYTMRAYCFEHIEKYQDALNDCEKSVELNNGYADITIFKTRSLANYKLGNFKKALIDFNQILETKKDSETYYYRALTNYKLKKIIQAHKDFATAIKLQADTELKQKEKIPVLIKIFLNSKNNKIVPIGLSKIQ